MVMLNFKTTTDQYVSINPKSISYVMAREQGCLIVMTNDDTLSIGESYLEVVGQIRGVHE